MTSYRIQGATGEWEVVIGLNVLSRGLYKEKRGKRW